MEDGADTDRRTPETICPIIKKGGDVCRGLPAWKCKSCYRATCGVHIDRTETGPLCTYCHGPVRLFRRRIGERRSKTGTND
jgi:hypothetical protein